MVAGLLYAGATLADIVTTVVALHLGMHEGNPLVAPLITHYGMVPAVLLSAGLCAALLWYARRGGSKLVLVLAAMRWVVVLNNVVQVTGLMHLSAFVPHLIPS